MRLFLSFAWLLPSLTDVLHHLTGRGEWVVGLELPRLEEELGGDRTPG